MALWVLFLLGGLAVLVIRLDAGQGSAADAAARDARLVFCLQSAHRTELIGAAQALGLARPAAAGDVLVGGQQLTLEGWRHRRRADFNRACTAVAADGMPAAAPASDATTSTLDVLLPVAAGALLTLGIDDLHRASDRGWAKADAMRAAWRAFAGAADDYVQLRLRGDQAGVPPAQLLDESRVDLVTTLRDVHSRHRRSTTIRALQDRLAGDVLGRRMTLDWDRGDSAPARTKRAERARQIKDDLAGAESSLEQVAHGLERAIWPFWKL
jgi:hypothetical protein